MAERGSKCWLAVEALVLLLPLSLLTIASVILSYPAYPIPDPEPVQIAFDLAMLLQVIAIIAAWRLVALHLRAGRRRLGNAHVAWFALLAAGAMVGVLGAIVAVEHATNPTDANDHVGFALLAPAVVLAPVCLHLLWERRRAR